MQRSPKAKLLLRANFDLAKRLSHPIHELGWRADRDITTISLRLATSSPRHILAYDWQLLSLRRHRSALEAIWAIPQRFEPVGPTTHRFEGCRGQNSMLRKMPWQFRRSPVEILLTEDFAVHSTGGGHVGRGVARATKWEEAATGGGRLQPWA